MWQGPGRDPRAGDGEEMRPSQPGLASTPRGLSPLCLGPGPTEATVPTKSLAMALVTGLTWGRESPQAQKLLQPNLQAWFVPMWGLAACSPRGTWPQAYGPCPGPAVPLWPAVPSSPTAPLQPAAPSSQLPPPASCPSTASYPLQSAVPILPAVPSSQLSPYCQLSLSSQLSLLVLSPLASCSLQPVSPYCQLSLPASCPLWGCPLWPAVPSSHLSLPASCPPLGPACSGLWTLHHGGAPSSQVRFRRPLLHGALPGAAAEGPDVPRSVLQESRASFRTRTTPPQARFISECRYVPESTEAPGLPGLRLAMSEQDPRPKL